MKIEIPDEIIREIQKMDYRIKTKNDIEKTISMIVADEIRRFQEIIADDYGINTEILKKYI